MTPQHDLFPEEPLPAGSDHEPAGSIELFPPSKHDVATSLAEELDNAAARVRKRLRVNRR